MISIDESTFLSDDLRLLESVEFKQRIDHVKQIIEDVKWDDIDPDMLTRSVFWQLLFHLRSPFSRCRLDLWIR